MKLFNAIVHRLAFCCTLLTIALIGLLFPKSALKMMKGAAKSIDEEFSSDE